MTALHVDPFAEAYDPLDRDSDRWQRPLIITPDGKKERYTRASTLANYLVDHSGLHTWEKRLIAVGLGQREDLAALAASLPRLNAEKCDKTTLTEEQINDDRLVNKELDQIIELAKEAANGSFKARYGTTIHNFTDPGADSDDVPTRMKGDVESWWQLLEQHNIEILATEVFVVNDELKAAGKFDHLLRFSSGGLGVVVGDKKTGQVAGKGLSFAVQLATYANSVVYDPYTGKREPLESLTGGERISRREAVVAHIPLGGKRTDLYRIDIAVGLHAARLACQVRKARTLKLSTLMEL